MTADLSALVARLEAAEVGSRELDEAISDALCVRKTRHFIAGVPDELWLYEFDGHEPSSALRVTQSLDAALALAERVLEGWSWEIRIDESGASVQAAPVWWMEGLAAPDEGGVSCEAATPALALCLAVLKAENHVE